MHPFSRIEYHLSNQLIESLNYPGQATTMLDLLKYTDDSDRYPAVDYNLSFSHQKCSRVYGDTALFGVKLFGMDELITQSNIPPSDYKTLYPLLCLMSAGIKKNSNPRLLISKFLICTY